MTRIVVAGAGAVGASVAYHLALLGADDVTLVDRGEIAGGATGKAMGGIRQQFSTEAEVRLAQASIRLFAELGPPFFHRVGYLFLATTEAGVAELEERRVLQASLGVPVERVDPSFVPGLAVADVAGAVFCAEDGVADPTAVTRELVRRAVEGGVVVHEWTPAQGVDADMLVIACGAASAQLAAARGVDVPIRPLCRQLLETGPLVGLPERLPMTIEAETGFHFRRRADRLVLAMSDPSPRWQTDEIVDESLVPDRLERLARRYPPAAGTRIERAWAGLYDMTPDAHPIVGPLAEGVYATFGFSGHGFMQAPAVGRAAAEELLGLEPSVDLAPYRAGRFAEGAAFPETMIL